MEVMRLKAVREQDFVKQFQQQTLVNIEIKKQLHPLLTEQPHLI